MSRIVVSILSVFISLVAFGQSNFRSGFVVTLQQDTLSGLVDFRDGRTAHDVCAFKTSETADFISYYPGDIKSYGFTNDKMMESRNVTLDNIEKSVFMEVVVRGTVTLYKLYDEFWVEKQGYGLYRLANTVMQQYDVNDRTRVRTDNRHIGTLNMMMHDCPKVTGSLETIELYKKPLTNLVEKYNKCVGDAKTVIYQSKKPWVLAKAGLVAGVSASQLDIMPVHPRYATLEGSTDWIASFIGGATLDVYLPRASERFAFTTSILYMSSSYHLHNQHLYGQIVLDDYLDVDLKQFRFPFGIKYTFKGTKFEPYTSVGTSLVRQLPSSELTWTQRVQDPNDTVVNERGSFGIQAPQGGFWIVLGMATPLSKKANAILELRIDRTSGITPKYDAGAGTKIVYYQLVLGLRMN